jgi:hypothetical protein
VKFTIELEVLNSELETWNSKLFYFSLFTVHSSLHLPHLQQHVCQMIDNFQQRSPGFIKLIGGG